MYFSRKSGVGPSICSKGHDVETPYYRPLELCIGGTRSRRWIPIEHRTTWPSRAKMNSTELDIYGKLCNPHIKFCLPICSNKYDVVLN